MTALMLHLWKPPGLRLVDGEVVDCYAECAECGGDGSVYDDELRIIQCPHCEGTGYRVMPTDLARSLDDYLQEIQVRYRVQHRLMDRYGTEAPDSVRDYWR